ncbi:hypothetical protein LIER_07696 [Lithospermum erythrorhizon]|uniref:Uncharacterized protein n=1 Tax=Lithospermum erythrorhizon TaxID=34254 RepID=A0AAV3P8Y7_LITER
MIHGVLSSSFQVAAHRRGYLHNDSNLEKAMEEASIYIMSFDLRRLFSTLLHYCKPLDSKKLFEDFYDHLAEDFKKAQMQLNLSDNDILYKVLQGINDTLESLGREINQFHLVSFIYRNGGLLLRRN